MSAATWTVDTWVESQASIRHTSHPTLHLNRRTWKWCAGTRPDDQGNEQLWWISSQPGVPCADSRTLVSEHIPWKVQNRQTRMDWREYLLIALRARMWVSNCLNVHESHNASPWISILESKMISMNYNQCQAGKLSINGCVETLFNFSNRPQGHHQSVVLQNAVNIKALHKSKRRTNKIIQ